MTALDITRTPWIGNVNGTVVGNVFAEFSPDPAGGVMMTLRVNTAAGIGVLVGPLVKDLDTVKARLNVEPPGEANIVGGAEVLFTMLTQERIEGRWQTGDGNAGTLQLVPAPLRLAQTDGPAPNPDAPPLQVVQSTRQLPKIVIFRNDLKDLSAHMKSWLKTTFDVVVKAELEGQDVRLLEADFWSRTLPSRTEHISLWLSEPGPMPRSINVVLSPADCSFTVTGSDPIWVAGTIEQMSKVLGPKHGWWKSVYEKHALNLNGIALLLAIALAPSLNLPSRIFLLGMTAVLAVCIKLLHDKTTELKIYLKDDYKKTSLLDLPRLLTTLSGAALIGLVTWAYNGLHSGALLSVMTWLSLQN